MEEENLGYGLKPTALQRRVELDTKMHRANQYATMLIHELSEAGFIADFCRHEAVYHLAQLFYKQDIEITTEEQRRCTAAVSS